MLRASHLLNSNTSVLLDKMKKQREIHHQMQKRLAEFEVRFFTPKTHPTVFLGERKEISNTYWKYGRRLWKSNKWFERSNQR